MSKINFLKPDKDNLTTFLYMGSFLFVISVIDVFLNSFFSLNITGFLPGIKMEKRLLLYLIEDLMLMVNILEE